MTWQPKRDSAFHRHSLRQQERRHFLARRWADGRSSDPPVKTREEAAAERAVLELKADQIESGFHSVMTSLSPEQLRDAEAAFRRLAGHSTSLAFCVDFALANYRPPEQEKPLDKAVEEYAASKRREHERGIISAIQVNSIKKELVLLVGYFPGSVVAPLTPKQLTAFCDRGSPSLKTYNNRRGILGTFFKFAFQ